MILELLHADTYLAMIRGSVGSQAYRHAYGILDGVATDLVHDGAHACAFFASDILLRFGLLKEPHLRVQGTVADLRRSDWLETDNPDVGDVLIWESIREEDGEEHFHIGFFLGEDRAISNLTSQRSPGEHHWTFGTGPDGTPSRAVAQAFTHPTFFEKAGYRRAAT